MTSAKHRPHSRARYQNGCKCDRCVKAGTAEPCRCMTCVNANRLYSRQHARGKQPLALVPNHDSETERPAAQPPAQPIFVQDAVQEELNLSGDAVKKAPGRAAAALAMARILDNPLATPQQPGAAAQLERLLTSINKASESGGAKQETEMQRMRRERKEREAAGNG